MKTLSTRVMTMVAVLALPCAAIRAQEAAPQGASLPPELLREIPAVAILEDDATPAQLAAEQYRLACRIYNTSLTRLLGGGGPGYHAPVTPDQVLEWSRKCLERRLDVAEGPGARRAVLVDEARRMKALETVFIQYAQGAGSPITLVDVDKIKYARRDVERQLAAPRP